MTSATDGLFSRTEDFPNSVAERRLRALVGLDHLIDRLTADAVALLDSQDLRRWSSLVHGEIIPAVEALTDRTPLFVFAGDVGTGKTELAEVIGQAIARRADVDVTLYPLSLSARGRGAVGEMTTLLGGAFDRLTSEFAGARGRDTRHDSFGILLIDEADSLAQSRELAQMHHEDRAGVNALLRGIDGMRADELPILTILCTNRLSALDPAVQRRAAAIEVFERPNSEQRLALLRRLLAGSKLSANDLMELSYATGPRDPRTFGFTYSDIRQRLVPEIALEAYRAGAPIDADVAKRVLLRVPATRPFEVG